MNELYRTKPFAAVLLSLGLTANHLVQTNHNCITIAQSTQRAVDVCIGMGGTSIRRILYIGSMHLLKVMLYTSAILLLYIPQILLILE